MFICRMKLLDPEMDVSEVIGLIYEMFSMSIFANDRTVVSLFKYIIWKTLILELFVDTKKLMMNLERKVEFQRSI